MKELTNEIYNELNDEFKDKFKFSEDIFNKFFEEYILKNISDTDILNVLNKKNRSIKDFENIEYLDNNRILLRTIKVLVILEVSKDFNEFKKLNKRLKSDKNNTEPIDFNKILKSILKVPKD